MSSFNCSFIKKKSKHNADEPNKNNISQRTLIAGTITGYLTLDFNFFLNLKKTQKFFDFYSKKENSI